MSGWPTALYGAMPKRIRPKRSSRDFGSDGWEGVLAANKNREAAILGLPGLYVVNLLILKLLCGNGLLARVLRRWSCGVVAFGRIVAVQVALDDYLLIGQNDALPADIAGLIVIFPNHIRIRG